MRNLLCILAAGAALAATPAAALTVNAAPSSLVLEAPVIQIAEGCGPGRWRGPWGGCRGPGWGGGYYAPPPAYYPPPPAWYGGNGCPPGFWRGPWGHCRDTPYHGRLPGGGWK